MRNVGAILVATQTGTGPWCGRGSVLQNNKPLVTKRQMSVLSATATQCISIAMFAWLADTGQNFSQQAKPKMLRHFGRVGRTVACNICFLDVVGAAKNERKIMSTNFINRANDEEIIDIVRSVLDNGTGKAETSNEHILIKLMQLRGTPITNFEFDQRRVDEQYASWVNDSAAAQEIKESQIQQATGQAQN